MGEFRNLSEYKSNAKIVNIFDDVLAVPDIVEYFYDFYERDSISLLGKVNNALTESNLEWSDVAKLLGVTDTTVKRWGKSKDLNDSVKKKIAALCSLLNYAKHNEMANQDVCNLVTRAISNLQNRIDSMQKTEDFEEQPLSSVFGISGLIATAWYLATRSQNISS